MMDGYKYAAPLVVPIYACPMPACDPLDGAADAAKKYKAIITRIAEIDAMRDIANHLDAMPADMRARVLAWIDSAYGGKP